MHSISASKFRLPLNNLLSISTKVSLELHALRCVLSLIPFHRRASNIKDSLWQGSTSMPWRDTLFMPMLPRISSIFHFSAMQVPFPGITFPLSVLERCFPYSYRWFSPEYHHGFLIILDCHFIISGSLLHYGHHARRWDMREGFAGAIMATWIMEDDFRHYAFIMVLIASWRHTSYSLPTGLIDYSRFRL
jgi:hypothetical protein